MNFERGSLLHYSNLPADWLLSYSMLGILQAAALTSCKIKNAQYCISTAGILPLNRLLPYKPNP
jgi:hypothetical protein